MLLQYPTQAQIGVSSFPPSSYRYCLLQTDKIAIKSNAELPRSFSKICAESSNTSKVCVWNHQDNHILINVACKSEANMIKWQRASIFANFEL